MTVIFIYVQNFVPCDETEVSFLLKCMFIILTLEGGGEENTKALTIKAGLGLHARTKLRVLRR